MAKLTINRGTNPNDGTGDNLRDGANKVNLNFDEIYTAIGDGTTVDGTIKVADDSSTVMTLSANGETIRVLGGAGIDTTISGNDIEIAVDGTVLSASQTSTLTNKTIDLTDNTITGTLAEFNTAVSDATLVSLTGSETITNKTINGPDNTLTNIANSSLSNSTITIRDDSSTEDAVSLGETLIVTGGTGITSSVASNTLTLDIDSTVATLTGTQTLTNKTIAAASNTISGLTNTNLSGTAAISNANLANSSITLGDDTISLGGTQTTVTNLSLDGATGTIDLTSSGNKLRFNFATDGDFPTASTYEGMYAWDVADSLPYVADDGGWVEILTENASVSKHADVNISGIADGNVLVWSSAQGRFNAGAASAGFTAGSDLDQAGADVQDVGYVSHRSPDATVTQTLTVTVATKTSEHVAFGDGSSNGYLIDGHEGAHVQLSPGVYKFDQADSSNSGHPLRFYDTASKTTLYSTGVTTAGTPGSSGAYTQITITKATPSTLHYQCTAHANMGGVVSVVGSENPRITENVNLTSTLSTTGNVDINARLRASKDSAAFDSQAYHQIVGAGSNFYELKIKNKAASPASQYICEIGFASASPDNSGAKFFQMLDSTTARVNINSDGDIQNHDNTYGAISDERIKQNIVDAGSQWDDIKNIRVRKYKKKHDVIQYGEENAPLELGLISQELESVSPGLVKEDAPDSSHAALHSDFTGDNPQNVKYVKYSILYMKAIKALQEAQTRIETLESKVTALENE